LLSALLLPTAALAQSVHGTITGTVTDASRKPLAGTRLQLTHDETNRRRNAVSDELGAFTVANLPPGDYRIEAELDGFRKHVQQVALQLNQEVQIEIPLITGPRTETVEVRATRGLLRAESGALGGVIENRQITGLPLDGRNFFELSLLLPGVAPPAPGSAGTVRGDLAVNINGSREDSNNFLLDGVFNGDPKLNGIAVTPPVDAVREFEVATNAYDASFGRNAGGQMNVVLKSGTNQVHGTAYEFFRNRVFDARNFFAAGSDKYQRNQFGGSLGGPLKRNRTFLFGDYEGRRVREGVTRITNVPTARERVGDFPGYPLPPSFLNPVGLAIAALYPLPNRNVLNQNYVSSPTLRDREDHFDLRIDHSLGSKDELTARYSFADRSLYEPFSGPTQPAIPGYGTNVPRRAQNAMAGSTHIFTANMLNELRVGFNRVSAGSFQENMGRNLNGEVGLPVISNKTRDYGLSQVSITGYSPIGDESNNPQHSATTIYQVTDAATWVRGRHLFRAGFDVRWIQQNAFRDEMSRGFLSFLGVSGNALAEMLLGFPSVTGVARLDNHQHLRTRGTYGYLQDTWRVRPDLTISAGVRYEFNSPPVDAEDRASLYNPATGSLVRVGTGGVPRGGYQPDRNNFAPRLGIAWRPGQGRTVLRAGCGVYYDQGALATGEGLYFNAPYFDFKLFVPYPPITLSLSDPFPQNFPIAVPSSALAYQSDLRTAYTDQWNISLQQEFSNNRVAEVAYVGTKGSKLLGARDLNQPAPSPLQPNLRPNPMFDDINILESRGNSTYHSLQARFQQSFHRGLTALASYTWSKSIDDSSSFFLSSGDANYPQDSRNTSAERALSGFDLRHRLSLSYSYDLPLGKGRLLGGWQTFGIWTFQTGRPFTVALLSDLDNSNTGRSILGFGANDRPHVLRNPELSDPTPERWFDTTAFVVPAYGTFGNSGRNILTGPGYQNISLSIVKNLAFNDGTTLQFRAEAFNVLNHANLDLPDIFVGSPTFGAIRSAQAPRRLQFGAKILF
jgi:hypothetical protein